MVYIGLIVWILLSSLLCFGNHLDVRKNRKLFVLLSFLYMCAIMSFRSVDVGVDTKSYQHIFELMCSTRISDILAHFHTYSMEVGYALAMKLCSLISSNYYFFQIVFSIAFNILSAKFIFEETDNIFVGVIVFLGIGIYATSFNIARQMLAVMLVANSWTLLRKEKKITAIFCVLLASTFHITALVFFAAYVVYFCRNNKFIIRIVPFVILIGAISFNRIFPLITRYFSYYHNYYANEKVIQSAGKVWIIWLIVLLIAINIIYVVKQKNFEHSIAAIFSLVWVACNVIGLSFNYFERLGLYFIPFVPVMISFYGIYLKNSTIRRVYIGGTSIAFIAYFIISMNSAQYIYTSFI